MTKRYIINRPNLQSPIEIYDIVSNKYIPIAADSNFKRLVCNLLNKHSNEQNNIKEIEFENITLSSDKIKNKQIRKYKNDKL